MDKLNPLMIILMALVALEGSSLAGLNKLIPEPDPCANKGLNDICISLDLSNRCDKVEECKEWEKLSPCDRGPAVFCNSSAEIIDTCKKTAFCLTWGSDDVTAVPIVNGHVIKIIKKFRSRVRLPYGG